MTNTNLSVNDFILTDQFDPTTDQPTAQWVLITSPVATEWLKRNVHNRPMAESVVNKYETDIRADAWTTTSATIAFDTDGNLIDGQHRMTAISRVDDAEIILLVVTGLPTAAQRRIDRGRTRTHGQQITMDGQKNGNAISAAARVRIMWENGLLFGDKNPTRSRSVITDSRLDDWIENHEPAVQFMTATLRVARSIPAPPRIVMAATSRFAEVDHEEATEFLVNLRDGGMALGNPVNTLRERLYRIQGMNQRVSDRDYLAFFILAWNSSREGRTMAKFQRPRGGSWSADNFPTTR